MPDKTHLYEYISGNRYRTWFLIFAVSALLVTVGYIIGAIMWDPVIALFVALFISVIMSLSSLYAGDKIVLKLMGAKPADVSTYRQLHNVVEEISIAAGIPKPAVYAIESPASNAFATGRNPEHASVAVTTGILEILNREELQGVMAHEISHIRHRDTLYAVVMGVLVGGIVILCDSFWRMIRYRRRSSRRGGGQADIVIFVIAILLAILAPLIAKFIQLAMSRRREFLADNGAVELTRNPLGLAKALDKVSKDNDPLDVANRGIQHLFFINPLSTKGLKKLNKFLSTHPPVAERINILESMAHSGEVSTKSGTQKSGNS